MVDLNAFDVALPGDELLSKLLRQPLTEVLMVLPSSEI